MYKIAICDDEELGLKGITELTESIMDELQLEYSLDQFTDSNALMKKMEDDGPYNLLLLDILLCGENGVEFAKTLRDMGISSSIIFISCSQDYILDGYDVQAVKYILKPVQRDQLANAITYDYNHHFKNRTIRLQYNSQIFSFEQQNVTYVEHQTRKIKIHLRNGDSEVLPGKLSEIENDLPSDQFCRCHISFLVNLEYVKLASRKEVELEDGTRIPVGRSFYKTFQLKMMKYFS